MGPGAYYSAKNTERGNGATALHAAVENGHAEASRMLLTLITLALALALTLTLALPLTLALALALALALTLALTLTLALPRRAACCWAGGRGSSPPWRAPPL